MTTKSIAWRALFLPIPVAVVLILTTLPGLALSADDKQIFDELYVCAMHPYEVSDKPGSCELCGMNLSLVHGHAAGTPAPPLSELYVDADNPLAVYEGEQSGKLLIPITDSPYYEPHETPAAESEAHGHATSSFGMAMTEADGADETSPTGLWTCGMHPEVIQDHPGLCPICHMELTPLKSGAGEGGTVRIDPVTLQNTGVTTAIVNWHDLSRTIRSNGTVKVAEDRETTINARISGWVEKLYVSRTGEYVRKGQPLLDIYSPDLVSTQQEYLLALNNYRKLKKGNDPATLTSAKLLVDAAERRLQLWGIQDEQIEEVAASGNVNRTLTLTAPSSGNVLAKNVIDGSAIKVGQNLFTISNLEQVWVWAQVYENEAPWIEKGDSIIVTSTYDPSLALHGVVDFLYPTLDPVSRTLELRIVLNNRKQLLRPEMFVEVAIQTKPVRNVIAIPKSALIRTGKRELVFVRTEPGVFEPRIVETGIETDELIQVTENLHAGETIATSAQFLIDSEARLQEAIARRISRTKAERSEP